MEERKLKIVILGENLDQSMNLAQTIYKMLPGSKIDICTNTLQCIKLIKTHDHDVILVDISISKIDSLKISQIAKKDKTLMLTPMLFITDDNQEFRIKAIEAGAEAFLVKPIKDTILITQLKAMAKIKERNILIKTQTKKLEALVKYRTRGMKREINERKKLEKELRRSKEVFKTYIKKAPIGIFVINDLGKYIDANDRAVKMMGRTKKETIGLSIIDYLLPGQAEKGLADFQTLKNKGEISAEYLVRRKGGDNYWISLFGTKIDDDRFLAFCVDISKSKFAEKELKRLNHSQQILSEKLVKKNEKLLQRLQQTINTLSRIGEMKDAYTADHQKRVALLSCAIAKKMGLTDYAIDNISVGARIHDIGKLQIPSGILNKPGKVSKLEYQILQSHVESSYEIVKEIDFPQEVIKMIHQHHERLDGTGYPNNLVGEQIIVESRILAVADVVEAMMSHRPYRPALGIDAAIDEITIHRGTKYDSKAVDVCIKLFREQGFDFSEK